MQNVNATKPHANLYRGISYGMVPSRSFPHLASMILDNGVTSQYLLPPEGVSLYWDRGDEKFFRVFQQNQFDFIVISQSDWIIKSPPIQTAWLQGMGEVVPQNEQSHDTAFLYRCYDQTPPVWAYAPSTRWYLEQHQPRLYEKSRACPPVGRFLHPILDVYHDEEKNQCTSK